MDTSAWAEDDAWDLINDDGFVYKLKKRRLHPTTTTTASPPPPDPSTEEKNRRERKKSALIKLKSKYLKEIHHWEHLSSTLKTMQQQTQNQPQPLEITASSFDLDMGSAPFLDKSSDSSCRRLLDDLLAQAEAQAATIRKASDLCNVADAMCNAKLERSKQSLMDLPIWAASPHELVVSLCEG